MRTRFRVRGQEWCTGAEAENFGHNSSATPENQKLELWDASTKTSFFAFRVAARVLRGEYVAELAIGALDDTQLLLDRSLVLLTVRFGVQHRLPMKE